MAAYYVNALTGSDGNSGSEAAPFASIARASSLVTAGSTVHVAPGIYPGGIVTAADGSAAAPIAFVSDVEGAAVVTPGGSAEAVWWVQGDYVVLDGFQVDGSSDPQGLLGNVGIYVSGSYDVVTNAVVHDIATGHVGDIGHGAGAIVADSYYGGAHATVSDSVVYNIGNDRFDQGIYMSTSGEVLNNTVYNVFAVGIHLWHNATNVHIENNIVYDNGLGILVGSGDYYNGFAGPDDYTSVINNTVYNNDYGISEQGFTGTHNAYVGNLVYNNSIYDYSLQNGNTFTPGDGAVVTPTASEPIPPPPPTTDWSDIVPPEPRLERWLERHQDGPQAGHGHHFMALIDLYRN